MVLLAYRKFKRGMIAAKLRRSEIVSDGSKLEDLNFPPAKFIAFPLIIGQNVQETFAENNIENTKLTDFFKISGITITTNIENKNQSKILKLSEEALSASLEYSYKKATKEVLHFNDKKVVEKISNGILYCKSRLVEGQTLRAVQKISSTCKVSLE